MPATPIIREDNTKPDGSRYVMVAWSVPQRGEYPEGVKYRFQYMDPDGNTLVRFNNSPNHPDVGRHHRHTPDGEIEPLAFNGIRDLAKAFLEEVTTLYEQRTD